MNEPGSRDLGAPPWPRPDGHIRILMLAANPRGTSTLAIGEEAREIAEKLRLSDGHDVFRLIPCWAVRPSDLLENLNRHRPRIVRFSCHGSAAGEIVLSADDGDEHRVGAEALAELFRTVKDHVRIVVLNACHSAVQARAIGQHVDYIVGMRAPIGDRAAIVFAAAFYSALGFHRTVREAFDQAITALRLHGIPEHLTPELVTRPGADPRFLLDDAAGRPETADREAAPPPQQINIGGPGSQYITQTGDIHVGDRRSDDERP